MHCHTLFTVRTMRKRGFAGSVFAEGGGERNPTQGGGSSADPAHARARVSEQVGASPGRDGAEKAYAGSGRPAPASSSR
jgi:hypothetical protein